MKAFFLAIALLNAAPKEQDLLILDLYDMDPRLVADVLDVVDELGGYTDDLAVIRNIMIAIIADSPGKTAPKKDEYIPGKGLQQDSFRCRNHWAPKKDEYIPGKGGGMLGGVSEDDGTKEITDPGRMLPLGGMITN